jgi:parallel beta-helix repeat protein
MNKPIIYLIFLNIFFLLWPGIISAYTASSPIFIENIQATSENPYIIEGYEISNPEGTCIKVINSKNVIVRNNYLHNCGTDQEFQIKTDHYQDGYATLIGDSSNIIFENNVLDNNFRGFMAYSTPYLSANNNKITNTLHHSPLWCEVCHHSEFSSNYLSDNGNPMHFWVPGERTIGIWIKRSDNVEIYDNTIIRSTSDGIAVTGHIYAESFTVRADPNMPHPQADWSANSNNVNIYNNLILDNMEQGIWLVNARNINVYDNTIRTGCFTYGSPISTEFNVGNSNFYNNKFLGCLVSVVGGAYSFNINVYDNSYYYYDEDWKHIMIFEDRIEDVVALASRQGAVYQESQGNQQSNNERIFIDGRLAEEMRAKLKYAQDNRTHEAQGWMACLSGDGHLDQDCVER